MVAPRKERVAVFGGDGHFDPRRLPGCRVRVYPSRRHGGGGPARRLEASIRAGGVDKVCVLTRWNGHTDTKGRDS